MPFVQLIGSVLGSPTISTQNFTLNVSATTAVGNTVILVCKGSGGFVVNSISDSRSNTWTVDVTNNQSGNTISVLRAYMKNPLQSGDTISIGFSGASLSQSTQAAEYSNISPVAPVEILSSKGASTVATIAPNAITNANSFDTLIAALTVNNTVTLTSPGGYNSRATLTETGLTLSLADKVPNASASNTTTWSWTGNNNAAAALIAYKPIQTGNFFRLMR